MAILTRRLRTLASIALANAVAIIITIYIYELDAASAAVRKARAVRSQEA